MSSERVLNGPIERECSHQPSSNGTVVVYGLCLERNVRRESLSSGTLDDWHIVTSQNASILDQLSSPREPCLVHCNHEMRNKGKILHHFTYLVYLKGRVLLSRMGGALIVARSSNDF